MKITVTNMACKHCVKTIKTALKENKIKAKVNLKDKSVIVDDSLKDLTFSVLKKCEYDPIVSE
jgi:copper chaperone CopZ